MVRTLTLALVASLVLSTPLHAAVLCAKKRGALAVREACRPKERPVDVVALGLVGPPGPPGPAGNALSGTPRREHFSLPGGIVTNSTFTTGTMLTDVVFFRLGGSSEPAVCTIVDAAGTITSAIVPQPGHVQLSFATPIVVSGTLAAGCNDPASPAEVLLVGTTPPP